MPFQYYELFSKRFGFTLKKSRNISFGKMALNFKTISEKAKNTHRCSKIPLHKNFKLVLQQNVMNQTYHKTRLKSSIYKARE